MVGRSGDWKLADALTIQNPKLVFLFTTIKAFSQRIKLTCRLEFCILLLPSSLTVGIASGVFVFSSSTCWSSIDKVSMGGIK